MKDEARFWKMVALTLAIILVMITSISAYYSMPGNLSDIANALDDIASALRDISYSI